MAMLNSISTHPKYHSALVLLMSYVDGMLYNKEQVFIPIQLNIVTAINVKNWLKMEVYRMINPSVNNLPTLGQLSTLEYNKKSILHYMPSWLTAWNDILPTGNPTKSIKVKNLINTVKKEEVQKQGKGSQSSIVL